MKLLTVGSQKFEGRFSVDYYGMDDCYYSIIEIQLFGRVYSIEFLNLVHVYKLNK